MSNSESPRKVDASDIEILDSHGGTIRPPESDASAKPGFFNGNIKVIKGGPALLLLLPVLIPVAILMVFLMLVGILVFGRSAIRVISTGIRRR
ncbi:MAG: hypothetical protein KGP28_05325 [Bdellovibrionales bacterium]|nr:hypothetical protein [Bdellovibrionales bacterium]